MLTAIGWARSTGPFGSCLSLLPPPTSPRPFPPAGNAGLAGRPVLSVESACASGAAALLAGRDAIESGRAEVVLCLGVEKAPRGFIAGAGFEPWQEASGVGVTPIYFALQAQELLAATGGTVQDLAMVSVKNHGHGKLNPNAMYRSPVTAEQVLQ